jgi:hypothetical protein
MEEIYPHLKALLLKTQGCNFYSRIEGGGRLGQIKKRGWRKTSVRGEYPENRKTGSWDSEPAPRSY